MIMGLAIPYLEKLLKIYHIFSVIVLCILFKLKKSKQLALFMNTILDSVSKNINFYICGRHKETPRE